MKKPIDRWGTDIPQWDTDFGGTFIHHLIDGFYSNDSLEQMSYLEGYVRGVRSGKWSENEKVAYVKKINENCPPFSSWCEIKPYRMESVLIWLEKLACGDETTWIQLLSETCRFNPRYMPEKNISARLMALSPFGEVEIQKYWCCTSAEQGEPHLGAVRFSGGLSLWDMLADMGAEIPSCGADFILLIPKEIISKVRVIRLETK